MGLMFVIFFAILSIIAFALSVSKKDLAYMQIFGLLLLLFVIGEYMYYKYKQKENILKVKYLAQQGKPIICYPEMFSNEGIIVKKPKLSGNTIISEEGKTYPISNCYPFKK